MVKEYSNTEPGLTKKQLTELDKRISNHTKGKTKNHPWKDSLKAIRKELGK